MSTRRNFSLDVLRGAAILLVLLRHTPGGATEGFPRAVFELGWTGVDLFFVLSGYLISTLLYAEVDRAGTLNVKRFWLRRGFKIWPSYFACFGLATLVTVAANLSTGNADGARKSLLASLPNLVFVQNYTGYQWPHTWSLAIEEHFYLALPLLLLLLTHKRVQRRLPSILLCVCVGALCLRSAMYFAGWGRWQSYYYPTHLRIDALAWGVLLGYFYRYEGARFGRWAKRWPLLLAASLPLLSVAVLFPLETSPAAVTFGFTLLYLGYGCLVMTSAAYPDAGKGFIPARLLAWMGVYSYTIYLAHSALSLVPAFGPESRAANIWAVRTLFWALSLVGGVLLSHAVERPFLRLRHRLYPPPKDQAASRERVGSRPAVGPQAEATA